MISNFGSGRAEHTVCYGRMRTQQGQTAVALNALTREMGPYVECKEACEEHLIVSMNRGYRPANTILIIRRIPIQVPLILANLHLQPMHDRSSDFVPGAKATSISRRYSPVRKTSVGNYVGRCYYFPSYFCPFCCYQDHHYYQTILVITGKSDSVCSFSNSE